MILSPNDAAAWAVSHRAAGRRVVFTNGVFDLLHPGHVRYLQQARALGDALIVAINSDRSVRRLGKGSDRPLMSELERAELLDALDTVDAVVIFDEPTPREIVDQLLPDVLVKGADWADGTIVGAATVEARGGRVVRVPIEPGFSTSVLVKRIRGGASPR